MVRFVKGTKATLGNMRKELNTNIARGSRNRQLTDGEIRARCEGLTAYCQLSQEEGGYASATAKAQMMAKVREEYETVANTEMTQRNTGLTDIAEKTR